MRKLAPPPVLWSWTVKVTWTIPGMDRPGSTVTKVTASTAAKARTAAKFVVFAPDSAKAVVVSKDFIVK